MEEKGSERRKFVRVLVRVLVDFESPDTFLYEYSTNVSEGGIFIETDKPTPLGTPLTLRFTLPGIDRVFEAKGTVRWLNDLQPNGKRSVPSLGPGMGVEFVGIDPADRELIRKYTVLNKS